MSRNEDPQWANIHKNTVIVDSRNNSVYDFALKGSPDNGSIFDFKFCWSIARNNSTFTNVNIHTIHDTDDVTKLARTSTLNIL